MKVTNIKQQVKNPERVSIFIDGKYSFSLSLDELLEQKIKNNDELDNPRLEKLKKISADGKTRMRALEWVLNRPRSIREFHDYLRRKKIEDDIKEKLTKEFLDKNYLNENKYAQWLVDVRAQGGKSNRAIIAELYKKGISREIIEEVLKDAASSEEARIKQVIAKRSKMPRYQKDPQKLINYLVRQGFNYDLIKENLSDLL